MIQSLYWVLVDNKVGVNSSVPEEGTNLPDNFAGVSKSPSKHILAN